LYVGLATVIRFTLACLWCLADVDEGYGSQIVGGVLTAYPCPADTFRQLVAYGIMPVDCEPCAPATNTQGKTGSRSEAGCDGHAAGYGEWLAGSGLMMAIPTWVHYYLLKARAYA
jgi:hypothetical protein